MNLPGVAWNWAAAFGTLDSNEGAPPGAATPMEGVVVLPVRKYQCQYVA